LDHALSGQIEQLSSAKPRALAQLLAYRLLKGLISPEQARKTMSRICWAEVRAADAAVAGESDPVKKLGLTASLPDFLAQSLWEQYGAESELLAQALHRRPPLTVRANLLKTTREELLNDLSSPHGEAFPTPFSTTGITLSAYLNIFELDLFKAGKIELQDEASQFIAELTAPPPDGLVVDFCAGSGGKTLALGALMKNRGRLIAADVNERKLDEFRKRARRAGLSNARAVLLDEQGPFPETLQAFVGKADRVLVDVPCSGAGAIRRKPEIRLRLTPEDPIRLSQEQEMIARRAMPLCAPGGRLIYATCSLLAEENERVVERLLRDDNFYLVPLKEILGKTRAAQVADASGMYLRMLPHIHNTDGFFAAVLRRRK
jgi:16S rRNA (cytosine967-C5)-methyltransferase